LLGFATLHDSRRYAIPRCLGPSHPDTKARLTGDDEYLYRILSRLCLRFPPPLHSCEQSALVAGRTAHQCCGQGQRSCRAEMQRRPSLFFELPAQPSSAFHRRFSELFSLTDDDIEDAPFCRRTCGCCERPLGSGGVFMAFDKNCAPPPHQLAGRATPGPYPNPNPNLNRHPPTTVSACFCADCSQACRTASVRASLTQTEASIRSRGADCTGSQGAGAKGAAPQGAAPPLPHIGQTIATPIALPPHAALMPPEIAAPSYKRQRSATTVNVPGDAPSPRAIECRGAGCARLRLRSPGWLRSVPG
jgi:hypothetical protein